MVSRVIATNEAGQVGLTIKCGRCNRIGHSWRFIRKHQGICYDGDPVILDMQDGTARPVTSKLEPRQKLGRYGYVSHY